ncbi:hypothetical protein [Streptomyces hirsutus]|uniref:hypothetical protein n=1 Tax=Streptomyces hirsutus TaxID=35620 RepID=UPI00366184B0
MTGRYHLVLSVDGRPTMHGWWGSAPVARRKLASWIGAYSRDGARLRLADEERGETLATWPDTS